MITYEQIIESIENLGRPDDGNGVGSVSGFKKAAEDAEYGIKPCMLFYMTKHPELPGLSVMRQCFNAAGEPITREEFFALTENK